MVRILYGIAGEGLGHAIRSQPIIDHLKKTHKVHIVSGNRAYQLLTKKYKDTTKIGTYHIVYKKNQVANIRTFLLFIISLPFFIFYNNLKLLFLIKKFKPNIIITDFEPFTNWLSIFLNIPCISIDNMHTFVKCKTINGSKNPITNIFGKIIINLFILRANYYLCTTFFYPKISNKKTFLFPPILRNEILNSNPKIKDYILIYQTSQSNNNLYKILKSINQKFIIYGQNKNNQTKNLTFRKTDQSKFIKDLKECKAVITNGGFTLISEALHLKKPILSIPIERQFEQIQNAFYLEKLNYGKYIKRANRQQITQFLANLKHYNTHLKSYKPSNNKKILKFLDHIITKFS